MGIPDSTFSENALIRLHRLLARDEQHRRQLGIWPPPITLPKLGGDSPAP
jgi:hypothetical protein